jgi:DNA-directed RNA polymerase
VDGTHAALGLRHDGGSEVTLHPSTSPPTRWRQLARLLHHHLQRLAPALRREKPQLLAAHVIRVPQRSHERSEI